MGVEPFADIMGAAVLMLSRVVKYLESFLVLEEGLAVRSHCFVRDQLHYFRTLILFAVKDIDDGCLKLLGKLRVAGVLLNVDDLPSVGDLQYMALLSFITHQEIKVQRQDHLAMIVLKIRRQESIQALGILRFEGSQHRAADGLDGVLLLIKLDNVGLVALVEDCDAVLEKGPITLQLGRLYNTVIFLVVIFQVFMVFPNGIADLF